MKAIIVSDVHNNICKLEEIVDFAKKNDIQAIIDAGDLFHGIYAYAKKPKDMELHAVYWKNAGPKTFEWFSEEIREIGGTAYDETALFKLSNAIFFMKHYFLECKENFDQKIREAKEVLDDFASKYPDEHLKKYIFFGHTHRQYLQKNKDVIILNPGAAESKMFAVLDTDTDVIKFKTYEGFCLKIHPASNITYFEMLDRNGSEYLINGELIAAEEFRKKQF